MEQQKSKLTYKEYGNGFRFLHVYLDYWNTSSLSLAVTVGREHETPPEYGLSHFVEHMLASAGSKNRSKENFLKALRLLGADMEAQTAHFSTNYSYKCLTANFPKLLEVVSEALFTPTSSSSEFENERKVILEELARQTKTQFYLDDVLFEKEDRRTEGNRFKRKPQ